jgi:hypothetical protein
MGEKERHLRERGRRMGEKGLGKGRGNKGRRKWEDRDRKDEIKGERMRKGRGGKGERKWGRGGWDGKGLEEEGRREREGRDVKYCLLWKRYRDRLGKERGERKMKEREDNNEWEGLQNKKENTVKNEEK